MAIRPKQSLVRYKRLKLTALSIEPAYYYYYFFKCTNFTVLLLILEKEEKYDTTGKKVYLAACKCLDITPVSFFLRNIKEKHLDLKHRLLGPKGGKALAAALEVCTNFFFFMPELRQFNFIAG